MDDAIRALLVTAVLICASCELGGGGGDLPTYPVRSGSYASRGTDTVLATFPHGTEPKTMDIDREAGVVRITYSLGGEEVVETWRITSSEIHVTE